MKQLISIIGAIALIFTLFFNVTLTNNIEGNSQLTLETLQDAKANHWGHNDEEDDEEEDKDDYIDNPTGQECWEEEECEDEEVCEWVAGSGDNPNPVEECFWDEVCYYTEVCEYV